MKLFTLFAFSFFCVSVSAEHSGIWESSSISCNSGEKPSIDYFVFTLNPGGGLIGWDSSDTYVENIEVRRDSEGRILDISGDSYTDSMVGVKMNGRGNGPCLGSSPCMCFGSPPSCIYPKETGKGKAEVSWREPDNKSGTSFLFGKLCPSKDLVTVRLKDSTPPPQPQKPDPVLLQVTAKGFHTCALTSNGVRCWGSNNYKQTHVPIDLQGPVQVSAGSDHTCALTGDSVRCWGMNGDEFINTAPDNLKAPLQISAGKTHTCAMTSDDVRCWGYNNVGQTDVPEDLKNPTQVSVGDFYTCAVANDDVRCWGMISERPETPKDLKSPTQVSVGWRHVCALTSNGVRCWGNNTWGQANVPSDLENPIQVSAGNDYTCALTSDRVRCWGNNISGQTDVPSDLKNPTQISAGDHHACALTSDGLRCWGNNTSGQTNVPKELKKK